MNFWRNIFGVLSCSLLIVACGNSPKEGGTIDSKQLDASLINNPYTADAKPDEVLQGLATMDFVDTSYDFGKMHEGESASYDFKFTNNGKAPLLISQAAGTCGCTIPNYPHEPIAPGQSGIINVKFNSTNKVGLQNKAVNIYTNSNKGTHNLHIAAEVME